MDGQSSRRQEMYGVCNNKSLMCHSGYGIIVKMVFFWKNVKLNNQSPDMYDDYIDSPLLGTENEEGNNDECHGRLYLQES